MVEAYSSGLAGLAEALRKGRRMGFPRFRRKGRGRESVCFTTGAIRVDDKSHVVPVRTHEPTTALRERPVSCALRYPERVGGCEVERAPKVPRFPDALVGVDAGLRRRANGWKTRARRIARLNRELARRKPGSRNREETRRRLARAHARAGRHATAPSWWRRWAWRG